MTEEEQIILEDIKSNKLTKVGLNYDNGQIFYKFNTVYKVDIEWAVNYLKSLRQKFIERKRLVERMDKGTKTIFDRFSL